MPFRLKYLRAVSACPVLSSGVNNPGIQSEAADEQPTAEGADRSSLVEWQRRLQASPGFRAIALKNRVKRIGYVFQGNVAQYKSFVAGLQDPTVSTPIMDVRNPDVHDDLLSEAERLLHNVLTAMSTRVDQQRRFVEKQFQDDPVLTQEYREKAAATFRSDPQANFLKGLRNYITHAQLPVAQSRQTLGRESCALTFLLPCEPLLAWDRWNGPMRTWIAEWGEAVEVVDVVDAYARMAGEFDKWLFDRIGLKYKADIDAFLREEEEFTRAFDRVFGA
ncbi:hypothetical protein [Streptomyces sp. F001]|uniref:hypothetical protein n=1 Tax=Streptomyces sp. F001 TaxID=1510026 RepID=UPI00101E7B00|nr:hypothetical protein [Streptomyces sp. F001]